MRTLIVLFLLFATLAHADDGLLTGLVSEPLSVPVTISGDALSLDGFVVRPDRPGRFPLVIMLHGTPGAGGDAFFAELVK